MAVIIIKKRVLYDLREYAGKEVTMSFKIKYVDLNNKSTVYIQNAKTDKNRTWISDINGEYTERIYSLKVDESGYLGFYIDRGQGIYIKDLQIELGNKKTEYEEFKYQLNAEIRINLEDKKDEIKTNDYYLRIYKNNVQIAEERYEEINEENRVENSIKNYLVEDNTKYKIGLLIKIRDRFYTINTVEFETDSGKEIKGIFSKEDYFEIQPRGNYIVFSDLDLTNDKKWFVLLIPIIGKGLWFNGTIDFNGHTVKTRAYSYMGMFGTIGKNGVVKNLVLDVYMDSTLGHGLFGGIACWNFGTISNIQVNLLECNHVSNSDVELVVYKNMGTIENFVINYAESLYGVVNLNAIGHNQGQVRNGYVIGKNLTVDNYQTTLNCSALVRHNGKSAVVKNVYSLVSVDTLNGECYSYGNIAMYNYENASVSNVYSVGKGKL